MASKIDGTNGLLQNYVYLDGTTTPSIVTGFSYTIPSGIQTVLLNPPATFGTGTVILPANPVDGMTVTISTTQQITSFTVSPSAGQTIAGGFSGVFQSRLSLSFTYNSSKTTWYPFTSVNSYKLPNPSTLGNLLVSDGTTWGSTAASSIAAGIGVGQTYTDFGVGSARAESTTYTNSTGKSILVCLTFQVWNSSGVATATVAGVSFTICGYATTQGQPTLGGASFIVPPGATYSVAASGPLTSGSNNITNWAELR